ncbi:hypothetical protein [Streptomyces pyxinae]|uniref:hypothetical protein n=1 Tax=Streptomyces pyxinae TaxID=2970734 RepID=UPI002867FF21|nr:hypothetical protein [Streptomyces sp. LP05-1]
MTGQTPPSTPSAPSTPIPSPPPSAPVSPPVPAPTQAPAPVSASASASAPERLVRDAALWIEALIRQFPELLTELAPGRPSPASRTGERRAPSPEADERVRTERREALLMRQRHGLDVPGPSTAPLRLYVSDAIRDITDGVVELDEAVHEKLGLGRPRHARVPLRLARLAGLLDEIAGHPVLAAHVRDEARRMARRCGRVLGDTESMVRLGGRCPWCDSVSLRAFPARRAVLCVNPACRCGDAGCDCGTDPAYRHVWPEAEWAALTRVSGGDRTEIDASMDETGPADGGRGVRTPVRAAGAHDATAGARTGGSRRGRDGARHSAGRTDPDAATALETTRATEPMETARAAGGAHDAAAGRASAPGAAHTPEGEVR